jgi:hypothetical protein
MLQVVFIALVIGKGLEIAQELGRMLDVGVYNSQLSVSSIRDRTRRPRQIEHDSQRRVVDHGLF